MANRNALIIYTSGTTGQPKGVVLTHGILHEQVSAVVQAWEISSKDSILHTLPLHHIHGIMNGLLCPLNVGGCLVMRPKFIASEVWEYFLNTDKMKPDVTLYFAVPTMYTMLIREFDEKSKNNSNTRNRPLNNIRLMSSGSAALPEPVFYKWETITGHRLLERFGMSEIGMALSNPLNGPRIPGCVGNPLPKVEVKIQKADDIAQETIDIVFGNDSEVVVKPEYKGESGELLIRGPNVFKEYWNKEKATQESFTKDGWFKTGDTATYESGSFKILGRTSVDIIKSGGYKISALQIESCILLHPDVAECTVFGIPDDVWGERVVAVVLLKKGKQLLDTDLKTWCQNHLPKYSVPSIIKFVDTIPRNVMGKVNKKELRLKF
ncbi:Acyl-CoA synthetase family member 3, mitochondrial, partial [Stegodyphus mimosarum]